MLGHWASTPITGVLVKLCCLVSVVRLIVRQVIDHYLSWCNKEQSVAFFSFSFFFFLVMCNPSSARQVFVCCLWASVVCQWAAGLSRSEAVVCLFYVRISQPHCRRLLGDLGWFWCSVYMRHLMYFVRLALYSTRIKFAISKK